MEKLRVKLSGWRPGKMARWEVDNKEKLAGLISFIVALLDPRKERQV